jgi:hypothetical protein
MRLHLFSLFFFFFFLFPKVFRGRSRYGTPDLIICDLIKIVASRWLMLAKQPVIRLYYNFLLWPRALP